MDVRDKARQADRLNSQQMKGTVVPKCARQHGELNRKNTVDAGVVRFIESALRGPHQLKPSTFILVEEPP